LVLYSKNILRKFRFVIGLIGHAEMEKEIQRTIKKITQDKDRLEIDTEQQQQPVELDENELKKYVDLVTREVKKKER
jgi:tripartite-type tricarboxylate transporter receptor subunit TctC